MRHAHKRLGQKLRRFRGPLPLRIYARKLGISHTTLNRLEMGKQNVTLATLEKLSERLKCRIVDLLAESDRKTGGDK